MGRSADEEIDAQLKRLHASAAVEQVNHPAHYGGADDPFETKKVIKAWSVRLNDLFTMYEAGVYFNVVKYLSRAGLKGDLLQDLEKAQWYLNELVDEVRARREG